MDFEFKYTPEMEEFRKEVRSWLDENLTPDVGAPVHALDVTYEQFKSNMAFRGRLGQKGWYAPQWPKEYGGGGLTPELAVVLEEELESRIDHLGNVMVNGDIGFTAAAAIMHMGDDEQRRRYLPEILSGKNVVWELFTEPNAGSDLPSMTTTAIRDGDEYIFNGQKIFVGALHDPNYMFAIAVTNPDRPRHANLGAFMIPADTPGITVHNLDLIGGGGKRSIFLEDVRVPADCLIGKEGEGWRAFTGRREISASAVVARNHNLERLLEHSKNHKRNGAPISEDPNVRDKLVEVYLRAHTLKLWSKRNCGIGITGQRFGYEGQQAGLNRKLFGPVLAETMLSAMGPAALIKDAEYGAYNGEAEAYARESIVMGHPGGTVEIHKMRMWRGFTGNTMFER